jgi:hypothetical protein
MCYKSFTYFLSPLVSVIQLCSGDPELHNTVMERKLAMKYLWKNVDEMFLIALIMRK